MNNKLTEEYVKNVLLPRAVQIAATAKRCVCESVRLCEDYVPTPVFYRGSEVWELGFVPKRVDCDGNCVFSNKVYLYRADTDTISGPDACEFSNGRWVRYPD